MASEQSDFDPNEVVKVTNRHNKDIGFLKKKVGELEAAWNEDAKYAERFAAVQRTSKVLNDSLEAAINAHDQHLLVIKGVALGKWLLVLVVGGILGALIIQVFTIPRYASELEDLRMQIEQKK